MKIIDPIQVEKKKNQILDISEEIINEQGIDGISIRKIAIKLNQTPGIIYHYFNNKEEILTSLVQRGYQEIVTILKKQDSQLGFEEQFKASISSYMKAMIAHKEVFLLLLQSKDQKLKAATSILSLQNVMARESMSSLVNSIQKGIDLQLFMAVEDIHTYAKLLWCSIYGLIERIIVEEISNKEADYFIDQFLYITFRGLKGN